MRTFRYRKTAPLGRETWSSLGLAICCAVCALEVPALRADNLQDIITSREYLKHSRTSSTHDLYGPKWLKEGTSFASVFQDSGGGKYLLEWLGAESVGLTPGAVDPVLTTEYAGATRDLLTSDLKKIRITALLPHPKYLSHVEVGLVPAFAAIEPPKLRIVYAKEIKLGDTSATSFEHENGSCSLVIKAPHGAVINIETDHTAQLPAMIEFAKKLDFKRLRDRLES